MGMRVLVIGASGQVGKRLVRLLKVRHDVVGTGFTRAAGLEPLDLGDVDAVTSLVERVRPQVIINPGGVTAVDWCEEHPAESRGANAEGPEAVARAAKRLGAHFVHFSTDFVFDGEQGPYSEEDEPSPISVYSETKLDGERRIRAVGGDWAILRTAVMYSYEVAEKNFLMQLVRAGEARKTYTAFTDQINSPSEADNMAEVAVEFMERRLCGLYHVAGSEGVSRFEFGREVMRAFGFPEDLVVPVQRKDVPQRARRPGNASLCVDKAAALLKTRLLGYREGIRRQAGIFREGFRT